MVAEQPEPMESEPEIITAPIPHSEGVKEVSLKRTKKYRKDAWDIIKTLPVPVELQDFVQFSPTAKNQIKQGLSQVKPDYIFQERVNSLELDKKPRTSSAYIQVTINNQVFQGIVDTGAGTCVISYDLCLLLKWTIDATAKRSVTIADGTHAATLGII